MSNQSATGANTNLYNICSLEHCYTNLFALTDLAGIKWLKLKCKEEYIRKHNSTKANLKRKKKFNDYDNNSEENDEDEEDEDVDDNEPDSVEQENETSDNDPLNNNQSTPKKSTKNAQSANSAFSSLNDPVLTTHAKCLNEDILCSWKRVIVTSYDQNTNCQEKKTTSEENENESHMFNERYVRKELWIFWFESEEPPNLKSLISNQLTVDNHGSSNDIGSLLAHACSSNNGLPYECRSMLFKALHNLIEKSLIQKGFARLGKWFVMPYNLSNVNYSVYFSDQINKPNEQAQTSNTQIGRAHV